MDLKPAFAALLLAIPAAAQVAAPVDTATVRVTVRAQSGAPIAGAAVFVVPGRRYVADDSGAARLRVTPGAVAIRATRVGFAPDSIQLDLRAGQDTSVVVSLVEAGEELEAVVASATRSNRRVTDTPLRVEVIDEEEIAEKVAMTPGDIAMMLNETSGLRVQSTSPGLGGAGLRIQGLRGRYTLMLADGLPLYGAQGGGFGLLQIPPVDLARAEVIKGTATALYGSSALGGVVNLVARRPGEEAISEVILNATSRGGFDAIAFEGRPFGDGPWGATVLVGKHLQAKRDLDADSWADMPGYDRVVARPRLFFDDGVQSAVATIGLIRESRNGGTMSGTGPAAYREGLNTSRYDVGTSARRILGSGAILSARASAAELEHTHRYGSREEDDTHTSRFGELSLALPRGSATHVGGVAYQQERYVGNHGFDYRVPSLFAQSDVDVAPWLVASASGRADWHNVYGTSFSPRVSLLVRGTEGMRYEGMTLRGSVGIGTFAPVPLTEETEAIPLGKVGFTGVGAERAASGSIDVHLPVETFAGTLELNASVFASAIDGAVGARETSYGRYIRDGGRPVPPATSCSGERAELELLNAPIPARAHGAELLARLVRGPARVTASYAYLRATEWDPEASTLVRRDVPLAPRHTAGLVASLEREDSHRLGLELYYTGAQSLADNPYRATSRPYLIVGALAERWIPTSVGVVRAFLNLENIGNVRQTRFDPLLLPRPGTGGRRTTDAWTELSGFVANGGVRIAY